MKKSLIKTVLETFVKANEVNDSDNEFQDNLPEDIGNILEGDYYLNDKEVVQPDGFEVCLADGFGGEGKGDKYWIVVSVKNTETEETAYVRFNGWYASYHGHEFHNEDFEIVKKKEVVVEQWVKVE